VSAAHESELKRAEFAKEQSEMTNLARLTEGAAAAAFAWAQLQPAKHRLRITSSYLAGVMILESPEYAGATGLRNEGAQNDAHDFVVEFAGGAWKKLVNLKTLKGSQGKTALPDVGQTTLPRLAKLVLGVSDERFSETCAAHSTTPERVGRDLPYRRALVARDCVADLIGCEQDAAGILRPTKAEGLRTLIENLQFYAGGPGAGIRGIVAAGDQLRAAWIEDVAWLFTVDLSQLIDPADFSFAPGFLTAEGGCRGSFTLHYKSKSERQSRPLFELQAHGGRKSSKLRVNVDFRRL
jgi:hypothetical protein